MWDNHWTAKKFSFASDIQDFKVNLTEQEKTMIIRALSAIGQVEVSVKTFWAKLGDNLPHPSIRDLGYVMANVEVIHGKAYEKLLEVLGLEDIFEENLKIDFIAGRVKYLRKHTHRFYKDSKKQFIYSLILFTLFVENVSLFSQFYVINSFGKRGLLKDTVNQTAYTIKEEDCHAQVGIQLVKDIRKEYPELFDAELEEKILHEAREAVKIESTFIKWMIGAFENEDVSVDIVEEFVKQRMNESLVEINYPAIFEVDSEKIKKTEWFYVSLKGNGKTDFFSGDPVDYAKANQSFEIEDLFED
jgi:ribonucleoside-diphosphate reductase beta chain